MFWKGMFLMENNQKAFAFYVELPEDLELCAHEQNEGVTDSKLGYPIYELYEDDDVYFDENHFENESVYEADFGHLYDATFGKDDSSVQKRYFTMEDFKVDDDDDHNK